MKSGNTGLYRVLQKHSELNMCVVMDSNFFNLAEDNKGTWELGINWYRGLFHPKPGLKGEVTSSYTSFPATSGVAARIYQTNPSVRLIYLMRNPVDRALSHYLHNVIMGFEKRPIRVAFKSGINSYVLSSLYFLQMQQYLRLFEREQLCILISESLWNDPNDTLCRLYNFLRISNIPLINNHIERVNATAPKATTRFSERPSNTAQEQLWLALTTMQVEMHASARLIAAALGFGPDDRKQLARRFIDDVYTLCNFLHFSIDEWRSDFEL